jgi:hypothetical protein
LRERPLWADSCSQVHWLADIERIAMEEQHDEDRQEHDLPLV